MVMKKPVSKQTRTPRLVNDVDPKPISKTPTSIRKKPVVKQPVYSYKPQVTPKQLSKNMKNKQAMKNRGL